VSKKKKKHNMRKQGNDMITSGTRGFQHYGNHTSQAMTQLWEMDFVMRRKRRVLQKPLRKLYCENRWNACYKQVRSKLI